MDVHFFVGRVVADPEMKTIGENQVTNFRLACDGRGRDAQPSFVNCAAWKPWAETIARYAPKGKQIALVAHLKQRSYDKEGQKHTVDEYVVDNVELLGKKGE